MIWSGTIGREGTCSTIMECLILSQISKCRRAVTVRQVDPCGSHTFAKRGWRHHSRFSGIRCHGDDSAAKQKAARIAFRGLLDEQMQPEHFLRRVANKL